MVFVMARAPLRAAGLKVGAPHFAHCHSTGSGGAFLYGFGGLLLALHPSRVNATVQGHAQAVCLISGGFNAPGANVTVYADVILPSTSIAAACLQGKPQRSNRPAASQSGQMCVNVNWVKILRLYDLGFVPMLPEVWATIEGIHEVTEGGAYGFLLA